MRERNPANSRVGRQQTDEKCRDTHRQQSADQGDLAAPLVSEDDRKRWRPVAELIIAAPNTRERSQQCGRAVAGRGTDAEKPVPRQSSLDIEIVKFDRRADEARKNYARVRIGRCGNI